MKILVVVVRKWFNKYLGRTYHTVRVAIDGDWVGGVLCTSCGDPVDNTVVGWLKTNGYFGLQPINRNEPLYLWAKRHGVKYLYSETQVGLKKHL